MPYNFLKEKLAQQNTMQNATDQGMNASIPGHGPNNIQLTQGNGSAITPGANLGGNTNGVMPPNQSNPKDVIKNMLMHVKNFKNGDDINTLKAEIMNAVNITPNGVPFYEGLKQSIYGLLQKLGPMSNPNKPTYNHFTNEREETIQERANQLLKELETREITFKKQAGHKMNKQTYNYKNNIMRVAADKTPQQKELDEHEEKKKKHGGNPFKVLLGMVETLINGGINDSDIVKQIGKKGNWDEKLIRKAIGYVKETKEKENASKAVKEQDKAEKKSNNVYNHAKFSAKNENSDSIYDVKPEYTKRSVGELMARARFLIAVGDYSASQKQGDMRKADDKSGAAAELKTIKEALKIYGFDDNELGNLLVTGSGDYIPDGANDYIRGKK